MPSGFLMKAWINVCVYFHAGFRMCCVFVALCCVFFASRPRASFRSALQNAPFSAQDMYIQFNELNKNKKKYILHLNNKVLILHPFFRWLVFIMVSRGSRCHRFSEKTNSQKNLHKNDFLQYSFLTLEVSRKNWYFWNGWKKKSGTNTLLEEFWGSHTSVPFVTSQIDTVRCALSEKWSSERK